MSVEETYDLWGQFYETLFPSYQDGVLDNRIPLERVIGKATGLAAALDIGCGIGFSALALSELGYQVRGIDISGRSIERAIAASREAGYAIEFARQDLLAHPGSGAYDVATMMASLISHFVTEEDQKLALANAVSHLKPDGKLVVSCHDYERMLEREPDLCLTPVRAMKSAGGTRMAFQKRNWAGSPRNRIYRSTYYHIDPSDNVRVITQEARAITAHEITEILRNLGMVDIEWIYPERSGYYQPICISRRRLNSEDRPSRLAAHRVRSGPTYRPRRLVMWSGGISSTYALVKTLKETEDEVFVHHIGHSSNITAEPDPTSFMGHNLESLATLFKLIKQRCRHFDISVSSIGPEKLNKHTNMMNVIGYIAAQAMMSRGMIVADSLVLGTYGDDIGAICRPDDPYQNGRFLIKQMVKTVMRSEDVPRICVPTPLPGKVQQQAYLLSTLGPEFICA